MGQFNIDVVDGVLKEDGHAFGYTYPILHVMPLFKRQSELFEILLPFVTNLITDSFRLPEYSVVCFELFTKSGLGIFDQIYNSPLKPQMNQARESLKFTESVGIVLSINRDKSIDDICFEIEIRADSSLVSFEAGTIDEFEFHVAHDIV